MASTAATSVAGAAPADAPQARDKYKGKGAMPLDSVLEGLLSLRSPAMPLSSPAATAGTTFPSSSPAAGPPVGAAAACAATDKAAMAAAATVTSAAAVVAHAAHAAAGAAESNKIQAEKLLVSIPTDSLDTSSIIASDPADAHRLALTAANAASVASHGEVGEEEGDEGLRLIINQQVALVPSQTSAVLSQNQESRIKNLEKIPPEAVRALEATLSAIPAWGVRITKEKLEVLGAVVLGSPVLMEGEKSDGRVDYSPKNYHIECKRCAKRFLGKNALRNFELHAIFWALYRAHPAIARAGPAAAATAATSSAVDAEENEGKDMPSGLEGPGSSSSSGSSNSGAVKAAAQVLGEHHQLNYPCNSVSRDVVVFMEARKPVLCNNQKKIFMLRGNLHHDTSLFQGRAWLQIPAGKTWECCKLADPNSTQNVLWCRGGKALEAYETLRSHIFSWHDSGVFTACRHCNRVYQNTRAFLSHGCVKKSPAGLLDDPYKDDTAVASCSQSMWSFLEVSPDFAQLFYQLQSLPTDRKEEVFDRVSKRLKSTTNL
ncbi:Hypothetical protein NocV09_00801350 [Nannochloropsis oceanica]